PDRAWLIYILSIVSVAIFWAVFRNVMTTPEAAAGSGLWGYIAATPFLGKVLFLTFLAAVIGIPIWSYKVGTRQEFQMMLAAIILVVFNVTFWTLFEQAASSLTLFADSNTTLHLFGFFISAPQTQNFNPITIVIFAPILSWLWIRLARAPARPSAFNKTIGYIWSALLMIVGLIVAWQVFVAIQSHMIAAVIAGLLLAVVALLGGRDWYRQVANWREESNLEPSIQVKFGIALLLVGLGFVVLAWSTGTANADFRVALWWLVQTYFLHSIAELCISPVGLSMITKLSIARVVGMMMGVWFLSISIGEYLAGAAAQAASVQTVGGQVTNPELALHTYAHTFMIGGESTMVAGVILLAISPWLKKIMHGVM